jgi:hypothetical protein
MYGAGGSSQRRRRSAKRRESRRPYTARMESSEDEGMKTIAALLLTAYTLAAAELKPATAQAFDQYIRSTERKLESRQAFLWCEEGPDRLLRARQGEIVVAPTGAKPETKVTDGLVHDWTGCTFIPGAMLARTLAMVQNYDRHKEVYRPEVLDSKLLSRDGNDFKIYLRLLKKKVITVVLDTEHDVRYTTIDATHARSRSYTTKIAEVENAGKPDERALPPGTGHGFLWKLDSYWRFVERDGGVFVECQAVSLTRDVPAGLGWIVEPIIRNLPRESLTSTLRSTRNFLAPNSPN